jgi:hypothetical protein
MRPCYGGFRVCSAAKLELTVVVTVRHAILAVWVFF